MPVGVINNVRMKSNSGWYLGSVQFFGSDPQPYDRQSQYYPIEDIVAREYPYSISMKQAIEQYNNVNNGEVLPLHAYRNFDTH